MAWDPPKTRRDQLVLFSQRLDEVLPGDHLARRMVEILDQLDWKVWEATYKHEGPGRAPIHPKVMSGIVLYGLMRGVRSSRRLEEALEMRLDFRWLGEGRSIDHSTLCRFRQSHSDRLSGPIASNCCSDGGQFDCASVAHGNYIDGKFGISQKTCIIERDSR